MQLDKFLPVAEHFVSINGEGQKSGQLAIFIRFTGCNLKCNYCDTIWANMPDAPFEKMTIDEICALVKQSGVNNVTLTGGEPLLQPLIKELIEKLLVLPDIRVEIETNGSVSIKQWENHDERLEFTLDYKLPGSGMQSHMNTDNYKYLKRSDTVKFVCSDENDLLKAKEIIDTYKLAGRCGLYLSPVFGRIEPDMMVEFMKENKMNDVNLQLQMHKFIWNPDKRGV